METRRVIKKIKQLRQIKPNEDWVNLTKNRILGRGKEVKLENWLFMPIKKPALVLAPLTMLAAVLGGLFVYFNFLPQQQTPVISQLFKNQNSGKIVASLETLQANLNQMTLTLNDLKNAKDPKQALVMTEIIKATAKNGEEIVGRMKTANKFQNSLASLGNAYQELGKAAGDTQVEMIGTLIEDLKQRTLTQKDQASLQKAEEYYNEGKYNEAILLIQKIGSNNN